MKRPRAFLDIECFINWFLVGITDDAGNRWEFQMPLDYAGLEAILRHFTIYTFNGNGYDLHMLKIAMGGASCEVLKQANDDIIVNKVPWWTVLRKYNAPKCEYIDHVDVSEPTPGVKVSLKQYAGRAHAEEMIETPVDFNKPMPADHIAQEIAYCVNDRKITRILADAIDKRLQLRESVSEQYGVDVRSKSDAQIAEAVIKAEVIAYIQDYEGVNGGPPPGVSYTRDGWGNIKINIPHYQHGHTFKCRIPEYVHFVTPEMQQVLREVRECDFYISNKEEAEALGFDGKNIKTGVRIPDSLKGRDIRIGRGVYRMGIGGLHSQESSIAHHSIPFVCTLETADVGSYYPSLIINAGLYPPQLGPLFIDIYQTIYKSRLEAKAAAKQAGLTADQYEVLATKEGGFKIVLNGTFGKLFSRFSIFYAPELGIAVTIGGQLSLLMLIERLEISGVEVISANTDGIELKVPAGKEWVVNEVMRWWQEATRLTLDRKSYKSLYSRDVNNYISVQFDGTTKRKGAYRPSGVLDNKHPDCDVCADAVVEFLTKGTPVEQTIQACTDIRKFVRIRGATGGGVYMGPGSWVERESYRDEGGKMQHRFVALHGYVYLGKAVRWYYSTQDGYIAAIESGNKVASSDNAMPCMTLPTSLPADINYPIYFQMAHDMLKDIGYAH